MKIKALFIIILTVFLLLGCAPSQELKVYEINNYDRNQMIISIMRDFRTAPVLSDKNYQFVNLDSIKKLYEIYKKEMFDKGVVGWEREFDCNRFSLSFMSFIQMKYATQSWGKEGLSEGIGIGEVYYISDRRAEGGSGGHAANILLVNGGYIFFEPQTGKIINLSEKEKKSIYFIKF